MRLKAGAAWFCLLAQTAGLGVAVPLRADPAPRTVAEPADTTWSLRFLPAEAASDSVSRWRPQPVSSRRKWGLIGAGAGLVAGVGMAMWVKSEADDRYDLYLSTADPDEANRAFESAQRYDRATLIGWGLAQVSFVALIYFLTRESERPLVPVKGEPIVRPSEGSLQVGFRVTP